MDKVFDIIKPQKKEEIAKNNKPKKKNSIWLWFIFLLIIATLIYLGYKYISKYKPINSNTKIEIPERDNSNLQNTSSAQDANNTTNQNNTPQVAEQTNPSQQNTEPKTPEIDKSTISIQILNASGQIGSAANAQNILIDNGFKQIAIGTAGSIYNSTVIYYKDSQDQAKLVANTLNDYQTSLEQSDELGDYDILIIVGQK